MKNTLPDYRGNRDTRGEGDRNATAMGPLVCLAMAVGLTTNVLAPCLAAAGLAGAAALLAATMAALFATLLAIVSFSVAAAIVAMLCSRADGGMLATILSCCGGERPSARAGALPNGAAPPAATLKPLSREPHEIA